MELKLDSADVRAILLEWAQGKFPEVKFVDCDFSSYSWDRGATLTTAEPEEFAEAA